MTFRVRRRRRGRPRLRGFRRRTTQRFLNGEQSIRSIANRTGHSYGAAHERLQRGITVLLRAATVRRLPHNGRCILVADAKWITVDGKRLTVYVVLLRPVSRSVANVTVVLPRWGWESEQGWREALSLFPERVRRRIVGATLDEHHGLRTAVIALCGERAIPIQWCHFHCLAELQRKLGKKGIKRNAWTSFAWIIARSLLRETGYDQRSIWLCMLRFVVTMPWCPAKTQEGVRWFLSRLDSVTVIYAFPSLRLPTTTGSAESLCELLRTLLHRVRPHSFVRAQRACELFLRRHSTIRCRPWKETLRKKQRKKLR